MTRDINAFIREAGSLKPTRRQLDWYDVGYYAFVHFTVNTYTDLEWGLGDENEMIFNPTDLNCDEWVEIIKAAGMKGMVLTCKHHDGFCLWPSKYTDHSVKKSLHFKGGQGDVVREAAEACRRGGIKFGIYLSPWDRHEKTYGTDAYNDYYCNTLTELVTQYGELFMVWLDGACGEGPNGKKQVYDFQRYIEIIRKYQPNAVISFVDGPDVRWGGNEDGDTRPAEWAVVPGELCPLSERQTNGKAAEGSLEGIRSFDANLGQISQLIYSEGLVFAPCEFDMSIRPGWFYHSYEEPHSLDRLFDTWMRTVGANAGLNLNIPPMPNGRIDPRDIQRAKELGDKLQAEFGNPLASEWKRIDKAADGSTQQADSTQAVFEITLPQVQKIRYIELREDIAQGQRVECFHVRCEPVFDHVAKGTSIGYRKISRLHHYKDGVGMVDWVETDRLTVRITSSRGPVCMKDIILY